MGHPQYAMVCRIMNVFFKQGIHALNRRDCLSATRWHDQEEPAGAIFLVVGDNAVNGCLLEIIESLGVRRPHVPPPCLTRDTYSSVLAREPCVYTCVSPAIGSFTGSPSRNTTSASSPLKSRMFVNL